MKVKSMLPALWGETSSEPETFRALQNEIDKLFGEFTTGLPSIGRWSGDGRFTPKIDIAETEKTLELAAELPGVSEKDIEVTLADDMLIIRAEKKSDTEEKTKNYRLVERSFGTFERSMRLPFKADAAKVEAKFDKGVLKLVVQKPVEAQARTRKIEVKAAA